MAASKCQVRAASDLEPLHQVGGAGEQDAPALFHQRQADGGGQMGFAAARSADQEQVGALVDPAVAGADRQAHVGLGDHRHGVEVEAVEGLAGQQLGLGEMAREAPAVPFGDLVLGERGQEACRRPAFLVRPLSKPASPA